MVSSAQQFKTIYRHEIKVVVWIEFINPCRLWLARGVVIYQPASNIIIQLGGNCIKKVLHICMDS